MVLRTTMPDPGESLVPGYDQVGDPIDAHQAPYPRFCLHYPSMYVAGFGAIVMSDYRGALSDLELKTTTGTGPGSIAPRLRQWLLDSATVEEARLAALPSGYMAPVFDDLDEADDLEDSEDDLDDDGPDPDPDDEDEE